MKKRDKDLIRVYVSQGVLYSSLATTTLVLLLIDIIVGFDNIITYLLFFALVFDFIIIYGCYQHFNRLLDNIE